MFPVLNALVAPMLPEPISLISFFEIMFSLGYSNKSAKVFPPIEFLEFIWSKDKYLETMHKKKVPITPTITIEKLNHHFTTGGQVAAPVVKEIVKKIAPILNIHPVVTDLPKIEQSLKLEILSNKVRLTNASL